jgi:anaerobic magnesium-protoporphyrin IX monomethyl ester cyclase
VDLLLINTPVHDYEVYPRDATSYSTPLGLLYLHAFVTRAGFQCEVIDAEAAKLSISDVVDLVLARKPINLGLNAFSVNFSYLRRIALGLSGTTKIIVGGPHATLCSPAHLLRELTFADYVVRGGGEIALAEILSGRSGATLPDNVYFRASDGRLHRGLMATAQPYVTLTDLPHPSRGLTPFEPYFRDGVLWADIAVSRGCKYKCAFCSGSSHSSGLDYSQRAMASTLDELGRLRRDFDIAGVEIVDDLPFKNRDDLRQFFLAVEDDGLAFQWELNLPISIVRTFTQEDLQYLRNRGLTRVAFGVESGDEVIRKRMGKKASDEEIESLCSRLSSIGISQKVYFIVGFPNERAIETAATLALARKVRSLTGERGSVSPRLFIYKPFPGSFLWKDLVSGYSEDSLLTFADFSLERSSYNKHAWMPIVQFCETPTSALVEMIDEFYREEGPASQ